MMQRTTIWLWLTMCGAAVVLLQFTSIGLPFYQVGEKVRDSFFAIPHTADLMILATLVAITLFVLTMKGRAPIQGRTVGLVIGFIALLAVLQLGYRMMAPPFVGPKADFNGLFSTGCYFYCWPSMATKGTLLPGIWVSFAGMVTIMLGGFLHSMSQTAKQTAAVDLSVKHQAGVNAWLLIAATSAVGSFIAGYTQFVFFGGRPNSNPEVATMGFSGWSASPHTSGLVLFVAMAVVALVWLAKKQRSFLSPVGIGAAIAVMGAITASRIFYRINVMPFKGGVFPEIGIAAYIALGLAVLVAVAGIIYALTNRKSTAESSADAEA